MSYIPPDNPEYTLRPYALPNGREPFTRWITKLRDVRGRLLVRQRLGRLQLGHIGDCVPLGDGLMEMRIHHGPGYRIYFGIESETLILLLVGGTKGTQQRDIERARRYWKDARI